MDPITLTAIAVFLSPYLEKAGEKVAEKTVEALFASRKDIAEKFIGLFKPEFQTLGLSEDSAASEIKLQLAAKPEIEESIRQKVKENQDLMNKLTEALSKQEGRIISCTTYIERIDHINEANFS